MALHLDDLLPGESFALAALPHRTGVLLRLGDGSALVRYDGNTSRRITVRRGSEVVRDVVFDAPGKPVTVARATAVVRR